MPFDLNRVSFASASSDAKDLQLLCGSLLRGVSVTELWVNTFVALIHKRCAAVHHYLSTLHCTLPCILYGTRHRLPLHLGSVVHFADHSCTYYHAVNPSILCEARCNEQEERGTLSVRWVNLSDYHESQRTLSWCDSMHVNAMYWEALLGCVALAWLLFGRWCFLMVPNGARSQDPIPKEMRERKSDWMCGHVDGLLPRKGLWPFTEKDLRVPTTRGTDCCPTKLAACADPYLLCWSRGALLQLFVLKTLIRSVLYVAHMYLSSSKPRPRTRTLGPIHKSLFWFRAHELVFAFRLPRNGDWPKGRPRLCLSNRSQFP